jgi:hypothetical protein
MTMKQFRVDTISTLPDGRIVLTGPSGSIDISRVNDSYSSACFYRYQFDGSLNDKSTHVVNISEIPQKPEKKTGLYGGPVIFSNSILNLLTNGRLVK